MQITRIMNPLDIEIFGKDEVKEHKTNWKSIQTYLNELKEGEDISFEQMLVKLGITEEKYLLAVRSSLNSPTVFLKRQANELRINNYNSACLAAWRANMDIQFVLDVYACAMYIVSYISKSQKGMSELLRNACDEAKRGNSTIKQQVRDIGNKFLNNVEISAQEAVYITLQLPMRKSSRQVVFINTSPPEDRVQLLKPLKDINEMEDDSQDVYTKGLIDRYAKRARNLEHLSLADWVAWYDLRGKPKNKKTNVVDVDNLPLERGDNDNDDDEETENDLPEKNGGKKRTKARIIRSTVILLGPFWPQGAVLASWRWGHFGSILGSK